MEYSNSRFAKIYLIFIVVEAIHELPLGRISLYSIYLRNAIVDF